MIQVKHLSKKFDDLVVLKDITIEIKTGEVIAIIGPSGTGKSTFLRCLNLLDQPSGGSIIVDGINILECKASQSPKLTNGTFLAIDDVQPMMTLVVAPVENGWPMKKGIDVVNIGEAIDMIRNLLGL